MYNIINVLYIYIVAGDTGHPLGNKWRDSEDYQILIDELNPILDNAIDQPDGITPKYATNSLIQVRTVCMYGTVVHKAIPSNVYCNEAFTTLNKFEIKRTFYHIS